MDEVHGDAAEMEMDKEDDGLGRCLSSFVDEGSTESHRYYLSRRTLLEMLRDRGYAIPNSEINLSLPEFRNIYGDTHLDVTRLRISAAKESDPSNKILVIFYGPNMVKVNGIRSIITQIMNKDSLSRLILIVENKMTNQAMRSMDLLSFEVEVFEITDLLVNITKHVLKPKHRVLTDEEKQNLLKKYNLEDKQLPRISQKDAIVQYYGLEKREVVEVTYSGESTGLHVTYRCVW